MGTTTVRFPSPALDVFRSTTDTLSRRRFRYNCYATVEGLCVPARCTNRTSTHLHPSRVPEKLLRELNDGRSYERGEREVR